MGKVVFLTVKYAAILI